MEFRILSNYNLNYGIAYSFEKWDINRPGTFIFVQIELIYAWSVHFLMKITNY